METLTYQAETQRLLDLVVHSLYTSRDVFLRELIANASDALDRLRIESLTRPELLEGEDALEIRLEVDAAARTLTIRDNGIGMSRDEVVSHLGTIARSGSRELMERFERDGGPPAELIGRFGVGFYSTFMVADRVTVVTRRPGEATAVRWESEGGAEYLLDIATEPRRGTAVTLALKPIDNEAGIEDYTDRWILTGLVKRFADFVTHPIVYVDAAQNADERDATPAAAESRIVLNTMKPIWTRPEREVAPDEFVEFYRHVAGDYREPMQRLSLRAEGRWEYTALLFIPSERRYDIFYHAAPYGLRLYSRHMLVMEECPDLIPRHLRFMRGIVDAADLPLNVSRQTLQHSQHLVQIRRWLTRKVVDHLTRLRDTDAEQYLHFWNQFGRVLKEGIGEDSDNQARLLAIAMFESSADPAKLTTLGEYVARLPSGQQDIYYLTGVSRAAIERAPQLEEFLARGREVLFLTDPVDELMVQAVPDFDGHRLRSVAKGTVRLGEPDEAATAERELEQASREFTSLLEAMQRLLSAHVRAVRLSQRLRVSPSCLVGEDHDLSPQMERLLMHGRGVGGRQRRILELNPHHPVVQRLQERYRAEPDDVHLKPYAQLLLGCATLAEGSELSDPAAFNESLVELLATSVK